MVNKFVVTIGDPIPAIVKATRWAPNDSKKWSYKFPGT